MTLNKLMVINFLLVSLVFTPILADFQLGDSTLPVDEEGFIEYDFEDKIASALSKVKVNVVEIYRFYDIFNGLGVKITVSELNSTSNKYETMFVDNIQYQNVTCLLYNKTHQFFRYGDNMSNLLLNGYGGYYIIPKNPVNVNIVKGFIEAYTVWSANVNDNTITIDIANIQAILTYNENGILVKEELKNNNEIIATLTLIELDEGDDLVLFITLIVIFAGCSSRTLRITSISASLNSNVALASLSVDCKSMFLSFNCFVMLFITLTLNFAGCSSKDFKIIST